MNEYQCIFCGKKIDSKKEKITSLLITINWESKSEIEEQQQVFCHLECFKHACNDDKNIYLEY